MERYIGKIVKVNNDNIYIDSSFPDEFAHSIYTARLKGGYAKTKANVSQGIIELLKIAKFKRKMNNKKIKHNKDAGRGWKYYNVKFELPIYNEKEKIITYNKYKATLAVKISLTGKLYLYDMLEIKKETSTPP